MAKKALIEFKYYANRECECENSEPGLFIKISLVMVKPILACALTLASRFNNTRQTRFAGNKEI